MLKKYEQKRDFQKTPEPAPSRAADDEGPLTFVIQKHAASRLHYDFRLEVDGVLKSWPIPKGPSLDPREKRLAVMVEDHPLDYASFEGVIPRGEYGGGQVIVWDAGTYTPDEDGGWLFYDRAEAQRRMREGIAKGKLSFFLRGHKLKGSWTLVKIANSEKDWLLIKHKDRYVDADRDVTEEDRSVLSGLTIEDLKAGRLPDRSHRSHLIRKPADVPAAVPAAFPKSMDPMQATLTEHAFSAPDWYFEPKLDGVRAISLRNEGKLRILSRRGLDATKQYPSICEELLALPDRQLVLDGEIVALDERGVPSFQVLQQRLNLQRESDIKRMESEIPVYYYVFDLLYADGCDLRGAQLADRKVLLKQLLLPTDRLLLLDHFEEDGESAYNAAVEHGLEGVVAKRRDSVYESGKRSRSWLKVKATREDEFVIGGYSAGAGGRSHTFGALLLGQYDDKGRLVYAGNVGTGFDDKTLKSLLARLRKLETEKCPFADPPGPGGLRYGRPKNAAITWVRPDLIAAVKFAHWTDDNRLRAPSFLGLRDDKPLKEVRREVPVPPPAGPPTPALPSGAADDEVQDVLDQLQQTADKFILRVAGEKVNVSNLDKEFWPAFEGQRALTKRDLLIYFARVSPYLLPHMRDRPLTLTRYPNGINGKHFYQKHWDAPLPAYVATVRLFSEHNAGDQDYLTCNNLPTLLWLGQVADIELHTWYSRVSPEPDGHHLGATFTGSAQNIDSSLLNYPDFIVFDLDPYIYSGQEARGEEPELNRKAFQKTCDVAFWLKDVLDSLSLSSFLKTTGRTGLHIYVPIRREFDYDAVRAAAETIGRYLVQSHHRDITMEWSVPKRAGKVFFDHNQNSRGKTLASLYSPRRSPEAAVSMPVRWDELRPDGRASAREVYPTYFTILNAPERLAQTGDLWADILGHKHDLAGLLGRE